MTEILVVREKQLDRYLKDQEVLSTFGNTEVVQMRNIVDKMRKQCLSPIE